MTFTATIRNTLSTVFAACGRNNSVVHSLLMWCCVLGMIFVIYLKFLADILRKIAEVMFDLCDRFDDKVDDVMSWTFDRVDEYDALTGLLFLSIVLMLWNFWFAVSFSYDFFVYPGFSVKTCLSAVISVLMTGTLFIVAMIVSETVKYGNLLRWRRKTDA